MVKLTKDTLGIPVQTGARETGVYADFGADGAVTLLGYWEDGKLMEALSFDDVPQGRFETHEYFAPSGDYQGDYSGLEATGVTGDQFDAMSGEAQETIVNELEHQEWLKEKIDHIGRDRTPNYEIYCSFCAKSSHEVKKIIAGPYTFICNECIKLCSDIVAEEDAAGGDDEAASPS